MQSSVNQHTFPHHVVCEPRFCEYDNYSISNRHGHKPARHDTRLHANGSLGMKHNTKSKIYIPLSNDKYMRKLHTSSSLLTRVTENAAESLH